VSRLPLRDTRKQVQIHLVVDLLLRLMLRYYMNLITNRYIKYLAEKEF